MKFGEVIGQGETLRRIVRMAEEDRLPHALLLCGPRGCGKMATAMALASYLLCPDSTAGDGACGKCRQCAMLRSWHHPDLHFSYPVIRPSGTGAEHRMSSDDFAAEWNAMLREDVYFSMDTWLGRMKAENQQAQMGVGESEAILRRLSLKSSQGGWKVCIIWLPERMNDECANKLLKIVEEPPYKTVFLMTSEQPELIIETIRSRTQRIDMSAIARADIERALMERRGLEAAAAARVARISGGSWLKACEELRADNERSSFLDLFKTLTRAAYRRDVREMKNWSDTLAGYGREKQKRLLTYFAHLIREYFMYNFHRPELCYMTMGEEDFAHGFARFVNETNVMELSAVIDRTLRDVSQNANPKMQLFDLALNVTRVLRRKQ